MAAHFENFETGRAPEQSWGRHTGRGRRRQGEAISSSAAHDAMSTSQILRDLYSLDTSSPDFSRNLYCLLKSDEDEQFLANTRGSELSRLVDFLDGVLDGVRAFLLVSFQLKK